MSAAVGLAGPSFVAFVVDDVEAARTFWTDVVGLKPAAQSPPGAQVFETSPIPFAIRAPRAGEVAGGGHGVAVWFAIGGSVDEYRAAVARRGANVGDLQDGPFGRTFTLDAPEGFVVTVHAQTS